MATPAPPHRAPRLVVLDPDPGRRRHLVDALAVTKVKGLPFTSAEIELFDDLELARAWVSVMDLPAPGGDPNAANT